MLKALFAKARNGDATCAKLLFESLTSDPLDDLLARVEALEAEPGPW